MEQLATSDSGEASLSCTTAALTVLRDKFTFQYIATAWIRPWRKDLTLSRKCQEIQKEPSL